jgi:hypothetical protein
MRVFNFKEGDASMTDSLPWSIVAALKGAALLALGQCIDGKEEFVETEDAGLVLQVLVRKVVGVGGYGVAVRGLLAADHETEIFTVKGIAKTASDVTTAMDNVVQELEWHWQATRRSGRLTEDKRTQLN